MFNKEGDLFVSGLGISIHCINVYFATKKYSGLHVHKRQFVERSGEV